MHAWPDYMAEWKVDVRLIPGWETRSRSSGGIDSLLGIWCHHTVSKTTPANDVAFCIKGSPDAPIGSGILARDGVFHFHTAGATNTNGRGGPWFTSIGVIPKDNGNRNGAAIEAANDGVGEVWPNVQRDAYVRLVASFVDMARREFGLPMQVDSVLAHHEWAPDRKTDPSGPPSPWGGPGRTLWRMDEFRGDVFAALLPPEGDEVTADEVKAIVDAAEKRIVARINRSIEVTREGRQEQRAQFKLLAAELNDNDNAE